MLKLNFLPSILKLKKGFIFIFVVFLYYVAARLGLLVATINNNASPVWPATGVAIGSLLILGRWVWPAIFIGALAVNFNTGASFWAVVIIAIGNTLESIVAHFIFQKIKSSESQLGFFTKAISIFSISILATFVSACMGAAALFISNIINFKSIAETLITWWIGDGMGALVLLPPILYFHQKNIFENFNFNFNLKKNLILLFLIGIISLIVDFVFFSANGSEYIFALLPCLLITVTWLGIGWNYLLTITLCVLGWTATAHNMGPFIGGTMNDNLIRFQLFTCVLCITSILLEYLKNVGPIRWPSSALLTGWLFSGITFYSFSNSGKKTDQIKFENLINKVETSINESLNLYTRALESGVGLFASSDHVSANEWKKFIEHIKIKERFPGLKGLGVIEYITEKQLPNFVESAKKNIYPNFDIKQVSSNVGGQSQTNQNDHLIIKYIEPISENLPALGLDVATEKNRREAAEQSRDLGEVIISDTIYLAQESYKKAGFLIYVPMYKHNVPLETVQQRRFAFTGLVYAPIIAEDFLQSAIKNYNHEINIAAFSSENLSEHNLIFTNQKNINNFHFEQTTSLRLAGRTFKIGWNKSKNFISSTDTIASWVGLCGGIITLCLAVVMSVLQQITVRANHIVKRKTKELDKAQIALVNSARLSSLGQMAGGVAHEINNPLAIIEGRAHQLEKLVKDKNIDFDKVTFITKNIISTVERITRIIKSLRIISRDGSEDKFAEMPIKNIIDLSLDLCAEKLKNNDVQIKINYDTNTKILASETQISQVLINLINNSYDAIENNSDPWIEISSKEDRDWIFLLIKDSGPRIPSHIADKIMEPFFTTKESGKGTGLGLSISKALIENHGGTLELDINDPHTCFILKLPKYKMS